MSQPGSAAHVLARRKPSAHDEWSSTRRSSWRRVLPPLLLGVVIGAVVAGGIGRGWGAGPSTPSPAFDAGTGSATSDSVQVQTGDGLGADAVDVSEAVTPEAAVAGFLAAEVDRDFARSFAYLDPGDAERVGSPELWRAAHRQIPSITGFRVTGTTDVEGQPAVATDLSLRSSLDPVLGLVPARARATWVTVQVPDGTYRVRYQDSRLDAVHPDPARAVDTATAWTRARIDCEVPAGLEGVTTLYGKPELANQLCGATGGVDVGDPQQLPPTGGSSDLVSAFGPDVAGWARVVVLSSPVELGVVLAPVDDQWVVIGVLPRQAL